MDLVDLKGRHQVPASASSSCQFHVAGCVRCVWDTRRHGTPHGATSDEFDYREVRSNPGSRCSVGHRGALRGCTEYINPLIRSRTNAARQEYTPITDSEYIGPHACTIPLYPVSPSQLPCNSHRLIHDRPRILVCQSHCEMHIQARIQARGMCKVLNRSTNPGWLDLWQIT